ncbi:MAG: hypothetical protein K1X51_09035 [Rhodospirillaceae bacterium]|nr:hypothetical protein [Rhodospirillaceae bacterium]
MDDTNLFTIANGAAASLTGLAGALVDSNLDEEAANRLSVVTGRQLGRISRALAQPSD